MPARRLVLLSAPLALATIRVAAAAGEDPGKVLLAYTQAWSSHDAEKAAALLAPDAVYLDITIGEPQTGRAEIKKNVIDIYLRAVPDLQWQVKGEPIVTGSRVAIEWQISGTNTGAWAEDSPASGRMFNFDGASVAEIRDGHIVQLTDYYDGLSFQSQLGWVE